jgi:hypothetical protein
VKREALNKKKILNISEVSLICGKLKTQQLQWYLLTSIKYLGYLQSRRNEIVDETGWGLFF